MKKEDVLKVLSKIIDPELGVNIVEAGLVKEVELKESEIVVKFMPTSPFCPLVRYFFEEIEGKLREKFPEKEIRVEFYEEGE